MSGWKGTKGKSNAWSKWKLKYAIERISFMPNINKIIIFIICLLIFLFFFLKSFVSAKSENAEEFEKYLVKYADTLQRFNRTSALFTNILQTLIHCGLPAGRAASIQIEFTLKISNESKNCFFISLLLLFLSNTLLLAITIPIMTSYICFLLLEFSKSTTDDDALCWVKFYFSPNYLKSYEVTLGNKTT